MKETADRMKELFKRTTEPILHPGNSPVWANGAVFNPGAWYDGNTVHMLFRGIPGGYRKVTLSDAAPGESGLGYEDYVSSLGYAHSPNGREFECRPESFIKPDSSYDRYGAEDARISGIDHTFLITYTALSQPAYGSADGVRIGLATTTDWITVEKKGIIGPPVRDKDAVIFPGYIKGRIAMLHRIHPNAQIAWFENLEQLMNPGENYWAEYLERLDDHVLLRPSFAWECRKVGAGATPVKTEEGWLIIYHGVDEKHVYRAGLMLLDLDNPVQVISRCPDPVLEPELEFELFGDVNNVVFPEGAVVIDGVLHIYYGAADRVVGHAEAPLHDVLACLKKFRL